MFMFNSTSSTFFIIQLIPSERLFKISDNDLDINLVLSVNCNM